MKTRMAQIEKRLRLAKAAVGKQLMDSLPAALMEYSQTGKLPDELLHRRFIELRDAFVKAAHAQHALASDDPNVVAERRSKAQQEYADADESYDEVLGEYGL